MLVSAQAFSQHSSLAYRKLADSLYVHHHYQDAINYYERALKKSRDPGNIMLQIAKSHLKTNQPHESEEWFLKARENKATLTLDDYYLYARALITLKKRNQADALLESILESDPNAQQVRRALTDLRNFEKYYQDSASFIIDSLNVNTSDAEFAPAYYKDGLVFSSARAEGPMRKKYHWDNSHFLNLYYSPMTKDKRFVAPEIFERELNTPHHEGPAMFYDNYQRMILNRNQPLKMKHRNDLYEWRLGLYDALFDPTKASWKVVPLPINQLEYSYAHPWISEDGNTLYFSSDRPGGYGGMDLYRVIRKDGVWGIPFNLGPAVNTAENEVFPFFIENTLYFASDGHGGLGGLDLFQCKLTVNGFSPPQNLGYPMNSPADDFSLITTGKQRNGYFASARSGNDDLFSFQKLAPNIKILAHIYDSLTRKPLAGADIQIITSTGGLDSTLKADENGDFVIELPEETAYMIIGTKDDKIGMVSDIADVSKINKIPAFADTTRVACLGFIQNEEGEPRTAKLISITDETTGETLDHPGDQSQITFLGKKGHNYNIDIQDERGNQANHKLAIGLNDKDPKIFTMILPDDHPVLEMSARLFKADDDQPVANANVRVITYGDNDMELTSDENGIVDFSLKEGTAFMIVGTKENLSGMQSGLAEKGVNDKVSMILPVPMYGDDKGVIALGLVTNTSGIPVGNYKATVKNKTTGEEIPSKAEKGLLSFNVDKGKEYDITVEHDDYLTSRQELSIPEDGPEIEKFTVVLEDKPNSKLKTLPLVALETDVIADNIKSGKSDLLLVDTDKGTSKMYIKSGDELSEITERDSLLYHQTPLGNEYLGKGLLSKLRRNPSSVLKGLDREDVTALRNIYFEFDKATLDEKDMEYLQQVKSILNLDRTTKLIIAGHADDRGSDDYNIKLSGRRAQAVSKFLISQGIPKERIILKAYGESLPVVPCFDADCSEDDHQQNRRAEFVLSQDDILDSRVSPKM